VTALYDGTDRAAPRILAEAATSCRQAADELDWDGTDTYRVGEWHVGVRSDSPATRATVRRLLATHHVAGAEAPANLSVRLAAGSSASGERGERALHLTFQSCQVRVRTRDGARALDGLLHQLQAFLPREPGCLVVQAAPVVSTDGAAYLLPAEALAWLKQLQPRLARLGLRLADVPFATVDPVSAELVVPVPGVEHDRAVVDAHASLPRGGSELARVLPGRYPLRAWAWPSGPDLTGPGAVALALAAILRTVDVEVLGPQPTLDALGAVLGRTVPYGVWYGSVGELVDQVASMLREA